MTRVLFVAANARSLIANRGDLIREMCRSGAEVEACVPIADYLDEVLSLGILVHKFSLARTALSPLKDLFTVLQLCKVFWKRRPDVVFCYGAKPIIFGSIAAAIARTPSIHVMVTGLGHAYTTESVRTKLIRVLLDPLYRLAFRCSRKVFFQNPDDESRFLGRAMLAKHQSVVVNGSGVNLDRFPVRPLPAVSSARFLFIGRLLYEKGLREFVQACRLVAAKCEHCEFVVVGGLDPSLPHSVSESELRSWEAEGLVRFVGGVKDVRGWLEWCSVFVLPSYREGTPRSVLEAMATGRPIVTTDAPGCKETVYDGENGYLVEPGNSGPLAEAMLRFVDDDSRIQRFGQASRRIAEQKYDVNKVNATLLQAMELK